MSTTGSPNHSPHKYRADIDDLRASASLPRYAFDARDGKGKHQFYFLKQVTSQGLEFSDLVGCVVRSYFVPTGTEDTLFGNGVTTQVNHKLGSDRLNPLFKRRTGTVGFLCSPQLPTGRLLPIWIWARSSIQPMEATTYPTM